MDEAAVKATRIAEQQKQVPYAERIWALTNVAGTLAMGGPGETEQARRLAEQAVSLKQEWIGAPRHPCAYEGAVVWPGRGLDKRNIY